VAKALRSETVKPSAVLLTDLKPVEYNPRRIGERQAEKLGEALRDFGFLQPLVVNTHQGREGRIVGGEQRWRQLVAQGHETAPDLPGGAPGVVYVDLPLERERELNVRLNRSGGEWDWGKLESEFKPADLVAWGFDDAEVEPPGGDWTEGGPLTAAAAAARGVVVRPVLSMAQAGLLEAALLATGNPNRGAALADVCEAYLAARAER
jgi:hypothetical protein